MCVLLPAALSLTPPCHPHPPDASAAHLAASTRCRTLFATHYHHLTSLATTYPESVKAAHMGARLEPPMGLAFTYELCEGTSPLVSPC